MKLTAGMPILNMASDPDDFGTLGGFVQNKDTGEVLGITAYHSVWRQGLSWAKFKATDMADQALLKVATLNEARDEKVSIGSIVKTHFDNYIEIALIKFHDDIANSIEFKPTGSCLLTDLKKDDVVKKNGARTQNTDGKFFDYREETPPFDYSGKTHFFRWLMLIERNTAKGFSEKGDSGSCIYKEGKVAGVLLGGDESFTFGMHAYYIEDSLNISF